MQGGPPELGVPVGVGSRARGERIAQDGEPLEQRRRSVVPGEVLTIVWVVLAWGGPAVVPVGVATGLLVAAIVASIALLVPINDQVKVWSAGDAPSDWRAQVKRWDRRHYGRVALLVAAFVLVALGLLGG